MLKSNSMCSFLHCIAKKFKQTFLHLVKKKKEKKTVRRFKTEFSDSIS